jgi:hypothetical protein
LAAAHSLSIADSNWPRWELEARLLTEQPFEQIATRLGTNAAAIVAYHDVFFNVRHRLHATDWVANHVIKTRASMGLRVPDAGQLLKHAAYTGGVLALESLLDFFRNPPVVPDRPELLDADCFGQLCSKLVINSSVLGHSILVNDPRAVQKSLLLNEATRRIRAAGQQFEAAQPLNVAISCDLGVLDTANRAEFDPFSGRDGHLEATLRCSRTASSVRAA